MSKDVALCPILFVGLITKMVKSIMALLLYVRPCKFSLGIANIPNQTPINIYRSFRRLILNGGGR